MFLIIRGLSRFSILSWVKIGILHLSRLSVSFKLSNVLTQSCSEYPRFSLMLAASVVMSHFLFLILFSWCQFCFSLDQFPSGVYQFYYLFKELSFGSVLIFAFLFYCFLFMPLLFTSSYFYWICLDIPCFLAAFCLNCCAQAFL